ncbi:MAG: hypothetical protein AAGC93_07470 [Cyanobacteria bacterium P01_F01_bin.53]
MKIQNLEHVKVVSTSEIVGGRGRRKGGFNTNRNKRLNIYIKERVDIQKYLDTYSFVYGNSAIAEGDAEAYGHDSNAEAFSFTVTTPYSSAASATSVSQS